MLKYGNCKIYKVTISQKQTFVISTPTLWFGGNENRGHTVWTVSQFIQTADSEAVGCIGG